MLKEEIFYNFPRKISYARLKKAKFSNKKKLQK